MSRSVVSSQMRDEFASASRSSAVEVSSSDAFSVPGVTCEPVGNSAMYERSGIQTQFRHESLVVRIRGKRAFQFPVQPGRKIPNHLRQFDTRDESSRTHDTTSSDGWPFDSAWIKTATSTSRADRRSNRVISGPASATICCRRMRAAERISGSSFSAESSFDEKIDVVEDSLPQIGPKQGLLEWHQGSPA